MSKVDELEELLLVDGRLGRSTGAEAGALGR